jgi:hypothetical protein
LVLITFLILSVSILFCFTLLKVSIKKCKHAHVKVLILYKSYNEGNFTNKTFELPYKIVFIFCYLLFLSLMFKCFYTLFFFRFPSGNVRMLPSLWIVSKPFLPSRIVLVPQLPNHKWKMRTRRLNSADELKVTTLRI